MPITIRVDDETHAELLRLAAEAGRTLMDTVAEAAVALRRSHFALQTALQYDELRSDPTSWQALLLPASMAEKLAPLIEDLLVAERSRARAVDGSLTISGDEIIRRLGLDDAAISAETADLLAMYNNREK